MNKSNYHTKQERMAIKTAQIVEKCENGHLF